MVTLQIKTSEAWRDVLSFDEERAAEIISGLSALAGILGESASWCFLYEDGRRRWLDQILTLAEFPGWQDVTPDLPGPLQDVMVSVYNPGDDEPLTFMAYRKVAGSDEFYISGSTNDERVKGVYAWGPLMMPAARNDFEQAAA